MGVSKAAASVAVVLLASTSAACGGGSMPARSPEARESAARPVVAPPPEPRPSQAASPTVRPTRGPSEAEQETLRSAMARGVARCFEILWATAPDRAGRAVFDVVYDEAGTLVNMVALSTDFPHAPSQCLREVVMQTSLRSPGGRDARVAMRLPIEMTPPPPAPPEPVLAQRSRRGR